MRRLASDDPVPTLRLEREAGGVVCGVDEVGRGPWAGPVVAAAVVLKADGLPAELGRGIDDSKKLAPARRDRLFAWLVEHAHIGIGQASVEEIDAHNILEATMLAMARAVDALAGSGLGLSLALVDGNRAPRLSCPARTVVRGDGLSLSIAAASIVAKVSRDRLMTKLAESHPGYGFERNFGYGTPAHRLALERLGPTPQHRRSFAPIQAYFSKG